MPDANSAVWMWHRDYLEGLAIEQECDDNPFIQKFRDYPEETGDTSFDNFSIRAVNR